MSDEYRTLLLRLFNESRVDYAGQYVKLFSAYNMWFSAISGETVDAAGIQALKRRPALWREVFQEECLPGLVSVMTKIMILTQHRPLIQKSGWKGYLEHPHDWAGLMDFWYAIRCDVVHGSRYLGLSHYPVLMKLAYESLFLYMNEIVLRSSLCQQRSDAGDVSAYVISPALGDVDGEPKQTFNRLWNLRAKEHHLNLDKPFTT